MKQIEKVYIVVGLIVVLLLNGCSKKGDVGPAGPVGKDGTNGTVNVTTAIFQVNTWSWSSPDYYVNMNIPELNSSISDSAAVMVYFNHGGSYWSALPYTQYGASHDYFMGFNMKAGEVQVTWFYDNPASTGDDPNTYYGTTVKCKVVIVPPALKKKHPDLDMNNYAAVKTRFGLAD